MCGIQESSVHRSNHPQRLKRSGCLVNPEQAMVCDGRDGSSSYEARDADAHEDVDITSSLLRRILELRRVCYCVCQHVFYASGTHADVMSVYRAEPRCSP